MAIAVMNTEYAPAKIVIGAYEFLSEEYNIDSISITTGSYDGNVVGIGSAYSPSCRVTMDNVDAIDVGVVFSVYFQKNGVWESYGTFVITDEPDVDNREKMSFVGEGYIYSIMSKQYKGVWGMGYNIELGTEVQYELLIKQFQAEFGFELIFSDSIKNELCTRHPINILFPKEKTDEVVYESEGTTLYAWEFIKVSWREWLQGLAILFGANVIEKNGKIYITELENSFSDTETIQISSEDCAELKLSRKDYTINGIKIKYQKTTDLGKPWDVEDTYDWDIHGPNVGISGTGEASVTYPLICMENAISYQYEIFCSWLRGTLRYFNAVRSFEKDPEEDGGKNHVFFPDEVPMPSELIKANNVVYRPGVIEYSGIVDGIEAGKVISIKNEDGTSHKFYVGEMTVEWDGGFKTILSCNSPANDSSSSVSSSISGGMNVQTPANSSYATLTQGLLGYVSLNFADISFSNIKDSTISGSKFIDGSITGSKIADSTITGSKIVDGTLDGKTKIKDATIDYAKMNSAFISDLIADSIFTQKLNAEVAEIDSLKATDAIIQNIFSESIISDEAIVSVLQANVINADVIKSATAEFGYITVDEANIRYATIEKLRVVETEVADKLSAKEADLKYANITLGNIDTANINKTNIGLLFAEVGLLDRADIVEGHVTGFLDAVQVNANKITTGTLIADRILLSGDKGGVLYALNNLGDLESTNIDTLDGYVLTDRTINADKIIAESITSNELDANEIFANSAILKKVSVGIADIIELDAGRITSGYINSKLIKASSIGSDKIRVGFGNNLATISELNEDSMFLLYADYSSSNIGVKITDGYVTWRTEDDSGVSFSPMLPSPLYSLPNPISGIALCEYTPIDTVSIGDIFQFDFDIKTDTSTTKIYPVIQFIREYTSENGVQLKETLRCISDFNGAYTTISQSEQDNISIEVVVGSNGTDEEYDESVKADLRKATHVILWLCSDNIDDATDNFYVKNVVVRKISQGELRVNGIADVSKLLSESINAQNATISKSLVVNDTITAETYIRSNGAVYGDSFITDNAKVLYNEISLGLGANQDRYIRLQSGLGEAYDGLHIQDNGDTLTTRLRATAQGVTAYPSSGYSGYAKIGADSEGGLLQIKGSGNAYEIDAAGGILRFIDATKKVEILTADSVGIKPKGRIVGGQWCYSDATNYGLKWASASVLRPVSASYKPSLGNSSYPLSSVYATNFYEGGTALSTKYQQIKDYSLLLTITATSGDGALSNFANYNEFVIVISANGFYTQHYIHKSTLTTVKKPFVGSWYYSASSFAMATFAMNNKGEYSVGQGVSQNTDGSSIAVYAR